MTLLGILLVAVGGYLTALNYWALVENRRHVRQGSYRHHSYIPILGGVLAAYGAYLLTGRALAALVAVIDPGVWVLFTLPVALLRQQAPKS